MKPRFSEPNIYRIAGNETDYNFPKPLATTRIGYGKHSYQLLELFCGFDIETTNITTPEGKHLAFAYHFQVSIGTPRTLNIYLFRKWEALLNFFDAIADFYNTGEGLHIMIAIANMSFEFQFLRERLHWDEGDFSFFAKAKNEPLKATYRGIEFREVLSLTGGGLAQLAKDYCYTQKLVTIDADGVKHSDLDYTKIRNSSTPLTAQEEAYCINDVHILSEFTWYLFNTYIREKRKIPMTFTGMLHDEFKDELKQLATQDDIKKGLPKGETLANFTQLLNQLQPSEEEYSIYMQFLFRGGYVHANVLFTGVDGLLANMWDITSQYPTAMNLKYFPVTPFRDIAYDPKYLKTHCCIMYVEFDYIRATTTHTIESKNKIPYSSGARYDNGRLISADIIGVYLTEVDLEIYTLYYRWEHMTIKSFKIAKRGKLPKYVTNVLNRHYRNKERLKRLGLDGTPEYKISKQRVNSCYGDLVKRMRLIKWIYANSIGWSEADNPITYDKEVKKAILSPYWGIYTTAHARAYTCKMIHKLTSAGIPCYYSDTDSIKNKPGHKAKNIIKRFNTAQYRHRKNRKLRSDFFKGLGDFVSEPKTKDGSTAVVKFKTLGAKRYIYEYDNTIYATVAGMPKQAIKHIGKSTAEIFDSFNIAGYSLTPEESDKLAASYTDEPYSYNVDGEIMTELSGVALYDTSFTLNIAADYSAYIEEIQKKGEAYI